MNVWLAGAFVLLVVMVPCFVAAVHGDLMNRLVALEAGTVLATMVLLLVAVGYGRESFVDLALTLALLSFGGGLVFARFLERWL